MELSESLANVNQILDEERRSPTISYKDSLEGSPGFLGIMAILAGAHYLNSLRSRRPRGVLEDPRRYIFKSTNYDLLVALLSRLPQEERQQFIHSVLLRLVQQSGCKVTQHAPYPSWNQLTSEFPLVAEFGIRNGAAGFLFRVLGEAKPLPGHPILLRHLEDMIALNFTVLTDAEYKDFSFSVANFAQAARRQLEVYEKKGFSTVSYGDLGSVKVPAVLREIIAAAESIQEQCRKASYLYLKGSLLEGLNLEINQDKDRVENYLQQFGFSKILAECLHKADQLYQGPADAFDLKSSMGHLRSFLENLHNDAGPSLEKKYGVPFAPGWGPSVDYLRKNGTFSEAEEKFVTSLYRLISDEAVHPLIAEREYARLARNMVIEYALLFMRKLEKLGLVRAHETVGGPAGKP
jgi:hypothetical protein